MTDFNLELTKHRVASDICCKILVELDAFFNHPSSVNLMQIQICLEHMFGEDSVFLTGLFECLFLEVDYIEVEVLSEKSLYHRIMMAALEEKVFQESIA